MPNVLSLIFSYWWLDGVAKSSQVKNVAEPKLSVSAEVSLRNRRVKTHVCIQASVLTMCTGTWITRFPMFRVNFVSRIRKQDWSQNQDTIVQVQALSEMTSVTIKHVKGKHVARYRRWPALKVQRISNRKWHSQLYTQTVAIYWTTTKKKHCTAVSWIMLTHICYRIETQSC